MTAVLDAARLVDYLTGVFHEPVKVVGLRALGNAAGADPKGFGYGVPVQVDCELSSGPRSVVVSRTRPASGFGHDYPADRAWQALHGHDAYNGFPRHARSLDVGFIRAGGDLVSAADAVDFFQVVEKVEGRLYWQDLDRMLTAPSTPLDVERTRALAGFLSEVHLAKRGEP